MTNLLLRRKISKKIHECQILCNDGLEIKFRRSRYIFFVTAKDAVTHRILGAIQFFSSPVFQERSIKAALFGVLPEAQNRGLEKLLMGSIFRILPDINHIFLHTRSTNQKAIAMYKEWGFVEVAGKLSNWTDMEYRVEQSNVLQSVFNQ